MDDNCRYCIMIFWSEEDHTFIAEVPELPDCAGDGATYQKALSKVLGIMRKRVESADKLGQALPEPKGRLVTGLEAEWEDTEPELFVASELRHTFHKPTCRWAEDWDHKHWWQKFDSHEEASAAGYVPCKTCCA